MVDALKKLDFLVNLTDVYDMWKTHDPLWLTSTRLYRVCSLASKVVYEGTATYFAKRLDTLLGKDATLKFDDTETEYYTGKEKEMEDFLQKIKDEVKIQKDKRGYSFAVIPTPKTISMSLAAEALFNDNPTLDYLILWNEGLKNAMSLRSRHVNLTGLHGVFGHEFSAGVSGGGSAKDPNSKTSWLRGEMQKLRNGGYCLSWVKDGEEKNGDIVLEEC